MACHPQVGSTWWEEWKWENYFENSKRWWIRCVVMRVSVCLSSLWKSEDNLLESVLPFHHGGFRDRIQVLTLWLSVTYREQRHLASPLFLRQFFTEPQVHWFSCLPGWLEPQRLSPLHFYSTGIKGANDYTGIWTQVSKSAMHFTNLTISPVS